jgi:hypothetical protein
MKATGFEIARKRMWIVDGNEKLFLRDIFFTNKILQANVHENNMLIALVDITIGKVLPRRYTTV